MPRKAHECQARQYSDQMICHACGLYWDINDPESPACQRKRAKNVPELVVELPQKRRGLPEELPPDVVVEMVKSYQANGGRAEGMRAAYRLLLDRLSLD